MTIKKEVALFHKRAMDFAEKGYYAKNKEYANKLFVKAFNLEIKAYFNCQIEPSRSILFKSAISLIENLEFVGDK